MSPTTTITLTHPTVATDPHRTVRPTPPTATTTAPATALDAALRIADAGIDLARRIARRIALPALTVGLALIMIWFGAPKLIPGGSPAEAIAVDTVSLLTGGIVAGDTARLLLGLIEVGLGIALLIPRLRPLALIAMLGHMAATFTPLFLFPELTWHGPLVGSLEGQYILKNILIVGAILVLLGFSPARRARSR